jgi:biotin-(acetyl-CoA carboxylase) ligase
VRVQRPSDDLEGEAVDLAMDGALVVDVAGERSEVRAGDVVHLRTGDD